MDQRVSNRMAFDDQDIMASNQGEGPDDHRLRIGDPSAKEKPTDLPYDAKPLHDDSKALESIKMFIQGIEVFDEPMDLDDASGSSETTSTSSIASPENQCDCESASCQNSRSSGTLPHISTCQKNASVKQKSIFGNGPGSPIPNEPLMEKGACDYDLDGKNTTADLQADTGVLQRDEDHVMLDQEDAAGSVSDETDFSDFELTMSQLEGEGGDDCGDDCDDACAEKYDFESRDCRDEDEAMEDAEEQLEESGEETGGRAEDKEKEGTEVYEERESEEDREVEAEKEVEQREEVEEEKEEDGKEQGEDEERGVGEREEKENDAIVDDSRGVPLVGADSSGATASASVWIDCMLSVGQSFPEPEEQVYALRESARRNLHKLPPAGRDVDDSGNYDPRDKSFSVVAAKHKTSDSCPSRQPRSTTQRDGPPSKRTVSMLRARQDGLSLVVTLSLQSEQGRQLLSESEDNWPDEYFNTFEEFGPEAVEQLLSQTGHGLRLKRQEISDESADTVGEHCADLHRGHPKARSCKHCLMWDQECTMMQPEQTYPCQFCVDEDCDCELFLSPTWKRPCENCRRRRVKCSYRRPDSDHSQPCDGCADHGVKCIAGPAAGTNLRMLPDGSAASDLAPKRNTPKKPIMGCVSCRRSEVTCSLLSTQDYPPCASCKKYDIECSLEPIAKNKQRKLLAATAKNSRIATQLAHPILFNQPAEECMWCINPTYGLVGWGAPREVEVSLSKDNSQYTEISDGFRSEGADESKMCAECTAHRLKFMICDHEDLTVLPEAAANGPPCKDDALQQLLDSEDAQEAMAQMMRWCSLCARPAAVQCSEGLVAGAGEACGLKLCLTCCQALLGLQKNGLGLNTLIEYLKAGTAPVSLYPEGMRADFEILGLGGLLYSTITKE